LAVAVAVALLAVTGPALARGAALTVRVQWGEELRPVLEDVAAQLRPGDLVLVDIAAKAAFDHYGPRLGVLRDGVVLFRTPPPGEGCGADFAALRAGAFGEGRVWLVFSHDLSEGRRLGTRDDLLSRVGTVTRLVRRVRAPGAEALLLHPSGTDLPRAPATPGRCLAVFRSAR
ncbi:MAG: hypothetical protein M3P93_18805, partial [Actinomycetota bacterium]|nr:hypothetical protein [Actinomycetota bacterium]